jgi:hypothetical protein
MKRMTFGLDLGAAYSKVAFRPALLQMPGKYASQETQVLAFKNKVALPSLVLHNGTRDTWYCANDAEGLNPDPKWEVFENWKSSLFSKDYPKNSEALDPVMDAYFDWLRIKLKDGGLILSDATNLRIAIPEFDNIEHQKIALIKSAERTGWKCKIKFISEPVANTIGAFTGGRNVITAYGDISYMPTFGMHTSGEGGTNLPFLIEQIREYNVNKRRKNQFLKVAVVDCGAFTLDIAIFDIDLKVTEGSQLPIQNPMSKSWPIGIVNILDGLCINKLLESKGLRRSNLKFDQVELAKRALYANQQYQLFHGGQIYELGVSDIDRRTLADGLAAYSSMVTTHIAKHMGNPEFAILSGGGLNIAKVAESLKSLMSNVHNLILPGDIVHDAINDLQLTELAAQETAPYFGRVATAVGAASIVTGL